MPVRLNRRVVRETAERDPFNGRVVVIELETGGHLLYVRQKGCRTKYPVTYASLFRWAAVNHARAAVEAKRKNRKVYVDRGKFR